MLPDRGSKKKNGKLPCHLPSSDWPVCYEDSCYLNRSCPVYKGHHPSPLRDYIPLPPVFIFLHPFEAVPYSYQIQVQDTNSDD